MLQGKLPKLKRYGWHWKLRRFTLGKSSPEFTHWCPLFWLTLFCILILPLTLIVKAIHFVCILLDQLFLYLDDQIAGTRLDRWIDNVTEENWYKTYNNPKRAPFSYRYYFMNKSQILSLLEQKLEQRRKLNARSFYTDGREKLNEKEREESIKVMLKKEAAERKKEEKKERSKKQWINFMQSTKNIFLPIIALATLYTVGYILAKIIQFAFFFGYWVTWSKIATLFIGLFVILLIVGVIIGIGATAGYITEKSKEKAKDMQLGKRASNKVKNAGKALANPFVIFWQYVVGFYSLIFDWFKDGCPPIEWDD